MRCALSTGLVFHSILLSSIPSLVACDFISSISCNSSVHDYFETIYNLALFHAHEQEFSGLFHTPSNIQSLLKAKQHNTLKSLKITTYFRSTERRLQIAIPTKERRFLLTERRFFAHPLIMIVTHTYSHFIINVLSYSMSKVIVSLFYKPLRHDKAIAWLVVYLPKCIRFG